MMDTNPASGPVRGRMAITQAARHYPLRLAVIDIRRNGSGFAITTLTKAARRSARATARAAGLPAHRACKSFDVCAHGQGATCSRGRASRKQLNSPGG